MSNLSGDITLHYATARADQIAKLQRYAGESAAARWFPVFSYVAIVALSWLSAWLFYVRQGDKNYLYIASASLALLLTLALPWLYRRYQDSFYASVLTDDKLRGLAGPIALAITQEGITEQGAVITVRANWADVVAVERHPGRTFIFAAPLIAIVVPDHAFGSDTERDTFVDLVRTRSDANRA